MNQEPADIIIIGAGAAGLTAACDLARMGRGVSIIEARDRIGGRIHTVQEKSLGIPIELGAEFIHGRSPHLWEMIEAARLPLYDLPDTHWWTERGRLHDGDEFWPQLERVMRKVRSIEGKDRSFRQLLDECCRGSRWEKAREIALMYVEGFHAADADRFSIRALAEAEGDGDDHRSYRLAGGYGALVDWLSAGARAMGVSIYLNTVVTEIAWGRGRVVVSARSGSGNELEPFIAKRAIVTLPAGVLQAEEGQPGAVRFDPPLPAMERALKKIAMGDAVRITLRFRGRFWEEMTLGRGREKRDMRGLNYLHAMNEEFTTWWTALPLRVPILTGWAGGPKAGKLADIGEEEVISKAIESLGRTLGMERNTLEDLLEGSHFHNWSGDPFTRGSYSYLGVGGINAQKLLVRPVEGTLFFAGEATATGGENGTVHGAIASGHRVARQVLRR